MNRQVKHILVCVLLLPICLWGCGEKDDEENNNGNDTDSTTDSEDPQDTSNDTDTQVLDTSNDTDTQVLDTSNDTDTQDTESDVDTEGDTGLIQAATVEEICDAIFTLCDSNWGWPDQQTCYDSFINSTDTDYITPCADETGYLECMGANQCASAADCTAFEACEPECWTNNCE